MMKKPNLGSWESCRFLVFLDFDGCMKKDSFFPRPVSLYWALQVSLDPCICSFETRSHESQAGFKLTV